MTLFPRSPLGRAAEFSQEISMTWSCAQCAGEGSSNDVGSVSRPVLRLAEDSHGYVTSPQGPDHLGDGGNRSVPSA